MRLLAKSTPRVKVYTIGTTEEGREMIAVAVASEALMAKLDENKADLAKLADPRTHQDGRRRWPIEIARRAAPVYYITGTIHSTEAGAPTALMELAYRLAVDDSAYVRNIREHVITLITPVVEPDGRDRVVDVYEWRKKHPKETPMSPVYWGHYVAHDNNRDAMALTLKLSQNVLNTYLGWKAQVLHDLHESGSFLYDNTIGNGPYNAWLDPILTNEWHLIGWNNVNEMTRMGMPGVYAWGTFDTWSPGYLMFMAATHNGISRLYETFGNSGSADTEERTLSADETSRTWFRQNPPISRVRWSLRNNNNYEQTGLLDLAQPHRQQPRLLPAQLLRQEQALDPEGEGRGAGRLRLPGERSAARRAGRAAARAAEAGGRDFARHVRVHRHDAGAAGGGAAAAGVAAAAAGANAEAGEDAPAPAAPPKPLPPVTREFPAGSYIVRMDQPYSRIADALLDYQYWAPNDAQARPYDDTGWTFPEGFAVQAVRVTDVKVLDVPMEPVKGEVSRRRAASPGTGSVFAINHNADNALITLRYRLKDADIQIAEEPFEAGGTKFARGSFVIKRRVAGRPRQGRRRSSASRRTRSRPRRRSRRTRPAPRGSRILHGWTQHADRRLVAAGVRRLRDSLRLHRSAGDPRHRRTCARSTTSSSSARAAARRWCRDAAVAQPDPVPPLDRDAEHRHLGADRRHPHRHGARRASCTCGSSSTPAACSSASNSSAEFAITNNFTYGVSVNRPGASSRVVGSLLRTKLVDDDEPARLRRARQPRDVQRQRRHLHASAPTSAAAGAAAGGGGGGARRRRARRRRRRPADRPRHAGRSRRRPGPRRPSRAPT